MTRVAGTVLVADDDGDVRALYRCWLAAAAEVRTATDGAEALERVDGAVDIVVLDREMPRRDGVAVARELDRRGDPPAVVMISGVEPDIDLLDVPVDDYLRKPVTRETVLERAGRAQAAAELPERQRRLLALDTRRRAVEAAAAKRVLAEEPRYQRALDRLSAAGADLERARGRLSAQADPVLTDR